MSSGPKQPGRANTRQTAWSAWLALVLAVAASAGSAAASVDSAAPLRVVFAAWQLAADRLSVVADAEVDHAGPRVGRPAPAVRTTAARSVCPTHALWALWVTSLPPPVR